MSHRHSRELTHIIAEQLAGMRIEIRELRLELDRRSMHQNGEVKRLDRKIETLYALPFLSSFILTHHRHQNSVANEKFGTGTTPATNAFKNQPSRSKNLSSTHFRVFSRH
jgi:hypothetical protein